MHKTVVTHKVDTSKSCVVKVLCMVRFGTKKGGNTILQFSSLRHSPPVSTENEKSDERNEKMKIWCLDSAKLNWIFIVTGNLCSFRSREIYKVANDDLG